MAPYSTQTTMAIGYLPRISPFSHYPVPDLHHLSSTIPSTVGFSFAETFSNFQQFQKFIYTCLPSYVEQGHILFCNLPVPSIDWCVFSCNPLKLSYQSVADLLFHDFVFCILFILLNEFFPAQGDCTFPQLSLLLKVSTLMGGI